MVSHIRSQATNKIVLDASDFLSFSRIFTGPGVDLSLNPTPCLEGISSWQVIMRYLNRNQLCLACGQWLSLHQILGITIEKPTRSSTSGWKVWLHWLLWSTLPLSNFKITIRCATTCEPVTSDSRYCGPPQVLEVMASTVTANCACYVLYSK